MAELAPYEMDGMFGRYLELFGGDLCEEDSHGFRVFGKHQFDTHHFTDRFPDKLILTSAVARYALYGTPLFPGR